MTRKRFCKILMGHGITRNEANMIVANRPRELSFKEYALSPGVMWYGVKCGIALMFKTAFNRSWAKIESIFRSAAREAYLDE